MAWREKPTVVAKALDPIRIACSTRADDIDAA
jgi:hypothetical protein